MAVGSLEGCLCLLTVLLISGKDSKINQTCLEELKHNSRFAKIVDARKKRNPVSFILHNNPPLNN